MMNKSDTNLPIIDPSAISILKKGLCDLGIDPICSEKLLSYLKLVISFGTHTNIIGTLDPLEIIERHILDSLTLFPHLPKDPISIADIGSGAGFPGIPLAIVSPHHITCVESKKKKGIFLKSTIASLNLGNCQVYNGNAGELTKKYFIITSRAFSDIEKIVKLTRHALSKNGRFMLLKGREEMIKQELSALPNLKNSTITPLWGTDEKNQRNLVTIEL